MNTIQIPSAAVAMTYLVRDEPDEDEEDEEEIHRKPDADEDEDDEYDDEGDGQDGGYSVCPPPYILIECLIRDSFGGDKFGRSSTARR